MDAKILTEKDTAVSVYHYPWWNDQEDRELAKADFNLTRGSL